MSTPAVLDLSIRQNETFEKTLQFTDASGSALDISTWTIKSEIREQNNLTLPLVTAFDFTVIDDGTATVLWSLSAASSSLLVKRSYKYDLIIEDTAYSPAKVKRYIEGKISVDPATTTL